MIKKNKGFSLIEVIVVMGLLSGLSLFVVNMMKQSNKASTKLDYKTDLTLITNEINTILSNPDSCLLTFGTTTTPSSISKTASVDKFSTTSAAGFGNSHIKVTSYNLVVTPAHPSEATLEVQFKNKNILKGKTGINNILRRIKLYIERNPTTGDITMCKSIADQTNSIWTRISGSADIYYSQTSPGAPSGSAVKVGIGTTTPQYMLDVVGLVQAVGHVYSSDRRLKKNILPIPNVLKRTLNLQGIMFQWKNTEINLIKDKNQLGFIAQDVEKVFPEVVLTSQRSGYKSVAYANLIAPLIEVVKIHQKQIESIKRRLKLLESEKNP